MNVKASAEPERGVCGDDDNDEEEGIRRRLANFGISQPWSSAW